MIDQAKFIWLSHNAKPDGKVVQDPNGLTTVQLRKNINLTHNSKNNKVVISLEGESKSFIITEQRQLEEVFKLHLLNENLTYKLYQYCEKNLKSK